MYHRRMDVGKSLITGNRRLMRSPILLAALVLILVGAGAALGWSLLGSPTQRFDSHQIVFGQPMFILHNQMHYGMVKTNFTTMAPEKSPKAVLPVKFYDFGNVKQSEITSRAFEIANQGSSPLVISSSFTTCSCTTAELSTAVIPPGKSGLVTIFFDGQNSTPGTKIRRGVIFETNDPSHPQVEIWIQAFITQ
ncbi:MAG: DUF1573 domain-containing protein [Bellilinea sp.]